MGTAIKHPVPDRVKPPFVFLTSGHSDAQDWASECPDVKNYKWRLYPVWHRMLYSCTHMATVGFKGLKKIWRAGTIDRQPSSGRPRSVCVSENTENVEDLVFSQEDNQKTHRLNRAISCETGIHWLTVHRIIYPNLQLNCVKRRRAQQLSETNRVARLTRCKQLL